MGYDFFLSVAFGYFLFLGIFGGVYDASFGDALLRSGVLYSPFSLSFPHFSRECLFLLVVPALSLVVRLLDLLQSLPLLGERQPLPVAGGEVPSKGLDLQAAGDPTLTLKSATVTDPLLHGSGQSNPEFPLSRYGPEQGELAGDWDLQVPLESTLPVSQEICRDRKPLLMALPKLCHT